MIRDKITENIPSEALKINGRVDCKNCGGQIISNSGKVMGNYKKRILFCWKCHRKVSDVEAYNARREGEVTKI